MGLFMNKKTFLLIGTLAVLLISPLTGAVMNQSTPEQESPQTTPITTQENNNANIEYGGTIQTFIGAYGSHLNPVDAESVTDGYLCQDLIFDSLIADNTIQPTNLSAFGGEIAKKVEYTYLNTTKHPITRRNGTTVNDPDGEATRWTITLRDDYSWHDGSPITAEDLIFTYQFDYWTAWKGGASADYTGDFFGTSGMDYYRATKINNYKVNVTIGKTGFEFKYYPLYPIPFPKHIYSNASTWGGPANETFNVDNAWNQGWSLTALDVLNYEPTGPDDPVYTGSGPWMPTFRNGDSPRTTTKYVFERYDYYRWSPYDPANGEVTHPWTDYEKYYQNPKKYNQEIWDPALGKVSEPILWGPYADKVEISLIRQNALQWSSFTQKEVDFEGGTSLTNHIKELHKMNFTLHSSAEMGIFNMNINCGPGYMSGLGKIGPGHTYFTRSAAFRRAVDWAVNKRKIVNDVLNGYAIPVDDLVTSVPYGSGWNWEPPAHRYGASIGKAHSLIKGMDKVAGDTDGDGFFEYSNGSTIRPLKVIYTAGSSTWAQVTAIIKENLESVGVPVERSTVTWPELLDTITGPKTPFQVAMHGWAVGGVPTWMEIWSKRYPMGQLEYGFQNQSYANATTKMKQQKYMKDSYQYAHKAQQIFYEQVPSPCLWRTKATSTYDQDEWKGAVPSTGGGYDNIWSYRFMVKAQAKPPTAKGYGVQQNAKLSGKEEIGTTFTDVVRTGEKLNVSYMSLSIDHGSEKLLDWEQVKTKTLADWEDFGINLEFKVTWNYTLDTTSYSNGKHLATLRVYGLRPTPIKYNLFLHINNPESLTQQPLPLAGICGIGSAVVVGLIVYFSMRKKKPPE